MLSFLSFLLFSPSLSLSSHYSRALYPPKRNSSDPGSNGGPFSPLPPSIRAFLHFYREKKSVFFFPRRLASDSSIRFALHRLIWALKAGNSVIIFVVIRLAPIALGVK